MGHSSQSPLKDLRKKMIECHQQKSLLRTALMNRQNNPRRITVYIQPQHLRNTVIVAVRNVAVLKARITAKHLEIATRLTF